MRLMPAVPRLMTMAQKPSLTAAGFLSQKMKMYLDRMTASRRSRHCHRIEFLTTDWKKQKFTGMGPKKYRGISDIWMMGTAIRAVQNIDTTSLFIKVLRWSCPNLSYQMRPRKSRMSTMVMVLPAMMLLSKL